MSSTPPRRALQQRREPATPFASYAQIVRMLVPLSGKIGFYDANGEALWISDGLEEPELRLQVEALLSRCASNAAGEVDFSDDTHGLPTYVFRIRHQNGALLGAMAIVLRDSSAQRRSDTAERLLAPLIDILSHGWLQPVSQMQAVEMFAEAAPTTSHSAANDADSSVPAAMRRTLATATHRLRCAFGAIVATEQPFTLTHRVSPDESDLTMNAAIESVRDSMLKMVKIRGEAFAVNGGARTHPAPHKFLVLPLRAASNRIVALMLLFRGKQDGDFTSADLVESKAIIADLPPERLAELAPESASAATKVIAQAASAATREMSASAAAVPEPSAITPLSERTMQARIRHALRDDGFDLYAQRISSLGDAHRPARFEVLVRMRDAKRLHTPASFFGTAQSNKLLPDLDRWVIRNLLSTLKSHAGAVRSARWEFSINLAAQSLADDRFNEFIVAEICRSSLPAELLVFEIAERDALANPAAVEQLGAHLRDVGARLALDNCRANLETFDSLHRWPVSCVKIDGSLIGQMGTHPRSESMIRAMSQLASSKGIETVAECVESADVCNRLIDMGIDYAQGFFFGRPRPLASLLA